MTEETKQVDNAFIRQYESEVHAAYQQRGSFIRRLVRNKTGVRGKSTTFQKVGTGQALQKTRKGKLPLMNIDHGNVELFLEDWHAPDFIDNFDELQIEHDERKVVTDAGGFALGRKTDEMLITNFDLTTKFVGDYSTALKKSLIAKAFKTLNESNVPDDGKRFAVLTPSSWEHFIDLEEVKNADYAEKLFPMLKGSEAIYWRKTTWIQSSLLPGVGTAQARCFLGHMTAAACATASEVKTDAGWERTYHSWFINSSMRQGAALIDENGLLAIHVDDTVDVTD